MYMMCGWAQCTMATFMLHSMYVRWYSFDFRVLIIFFFGLSCFVCVLLYFLYASGAHNWRQYNNINSMNKRYTVILAQVHLMCPIWKLLKKLKFVNFETSLIRSAQTSCFNEKNKHTIIRFRFVMHYAVCWRYQEWPIWFSLFCILCCYFVYVCLLLHFPLFHIFLFHSHFWRFFNLNNVNENLKYLWCDFDIWCVFQLNA